MTFEIALQSLFIGISLAAIPGPIFFELTRRTLAGGFITGALVAVGEFLSNFFFLVVIFFGAAQYLTEPIVQALFYVAGSLVLLYLAYAAFRVKTSDVDGSYDRPDRHSNSVIAGFLIAATSPIVFAFWVSLSGSYLSQFDTALESFIAILLIALGVLLFFTVLAGIINATKKRIPTRFVIGLSRVFGLVLLGYGIFFIYELVKLVLAL